VSRLAYPLAGAEYGLVPVFWADGLEPIGFAVERVVVGTDLLPFAPVPFWYELGTSAVV